LTTGRRKKLPMHPAIPLTTTVSFVPKFAKRLRLWRNLVLIALALAWFALAQMAQAQDGGYRNGSTAEGDFALNTIITDSTATGRINTGIGLNALRYDSSGESNTACGAYALGLNQAGTN